MLFSASMIHQLIEVSDLTLTFFCTGRRLLMAGQAADLTLTEVRMS